MAFIIFVYIICVLGGIGGSLIMGVAAFIMTIVFVSIALNNSQLDNYKPSAGETIDSRKIIQDQVNDVQKNTMKKKYLNGEYNTPSDKYDCPTKYYSKDQTKDTV